MGFQKTGFGFFKEFLQGLLTHLNQDSDLNVTELMKRLFEKGSKAKMLYKAFLHFFAKFLMIFQLAYSTLKNLQKWQKFGKKWRREIPGNKNVNQLSGWIGIITAID